MGGEVEEGKDLRVGILGSVHIELKTGKLFTRDPWHGVSGKGLIRAKSAGRWGTSGGKREGGEE